MAKMLFSKIIVNVNYWKASKEQDERSFQNLSSTIISPVKPWSTQICHKRQNSIGTSEISWNVVPLFSPFRQEKPQLAGNLRQLKIGPTICREMDRKLAPVIYCNMESHAFFKAPEYRETYHYPDLVANKTRRQTRKAMNRHEKSWWISVTSVWWCFWSQQVCARKTVESVQIL